MRLLIPTPPYHPMSLMHMFACQHFLYFCPQICINHHLHIFLAAHSLLAHSLPLPHKPKHLPPSLTLTWSSIHQPNKNTYLNPPLPYQTHQLPPPTPFLLHLPQSPCLTRWLLGAVITLHG